MTLTLDLHPVQFVIHISTIDDPSVISLYIHETGFNATVLMWCELSEIRIKQINFNSEGFISDFHTSSGTEYYVNRSLLKRIDKKSYSRDD